MTTQSFAEKHGIEFDFTVAEENPNMDGIPEGSMHYLCTFSLAGVTMDVPFSMGPALCRDPELGEVLDCLLADAWGLANSRSFEDWAAELGYDEDSRKAEKTYRAVERQTRQLREFLGNHWEDFMGCEETA